MDFHIHLQRAAGMGLVPFDPQIFIMEGLLNVLVDSGMKISAGIDGKPVTIGSEILIQGKGGFLGANIPEGYIDGPWQKDRKKCQVPVDGPEFMPDFLAIMGISAKYHGSYGIVQVGFGNGTASCSQAGGYSLKAIVTSQFQCKDIPVHGGSAFSFLIEQAVVSLYPPSFELYDFHYDSLNG
jgi:hypothetical protein